MRHHSIAGFILAAVAVASACAPPTSPLDLAGVYTLETVNGRTLPYALPTAEVTVVEVLSDVFTLHPAGTYSEVGQKRYTSRGMVSVAFVTDAGSFTRRGDAVTLASLLFGARSGTVVNGTFTLVDQDVTLVYRK